MSTDSSGISFTAHYTGEVWLRQGWSDPALSTPQGRLFYQAARPLEMAARWLTGSNNELLLLQRHAIIDYWLHQALQLNPDLQVVELACGLSPRGQSFIRQYPEMTYLEADLPEMAFRKLKRLEAMGVQAKRHRVAVCNILQTEGEYSLAALAKRELQADKPVLCITEGLVNYFTLPVISRFWQSLAQMLSTFPQGRYLTDLYPDFSWHPHIRWVRPLKNILAWATEAEVSLHFADEQQIRQHMRSLGFADCQVHVPESYYGWLEDLPILPVPSLVRVVDCSL